MGNVFDYETFDREYPRYFKWYDNEFPAYRDEHGFMYIAHGGEERPVDLEKFLTTAVPISKEEFEALKAEMQAA